MTNTNEISMLIQNIDNAEMNATVSVLESLIQCYQKEITIQENCSCDISEFSIYQEADDVSDKKSKIKMLWERFLKFIERIKIYLTKLDFDKMKKNAEELKKRGVKEIEFTEDECILMRRTDTLELCVYGDISAHFDPINTDLAIEIDKRISDFAIELDKRVDEILVSTKSDIHKSITIDKFIIKIKSLCSKGQYMSNKKSKRQEGFFEDINIDKLSPDEVKEVESSINVFMKVYNEFYKHLVLTYRMFDNKIKQYMNQKNNNQSNINTESFYVDDEFDDFDFYDEGFKDIAKSAWAGKGSNESKIKKILMFIPRLLMQLFKAVGNLWKNRKSQQLVKRLDELEKQIKDKDSEINKLKGMVDENTISNNSNGLKIDINNEKVVKYVDELTAKIKNIEDQYEKLYNKEKDDIEKIDKKYIYLINAERRGREKDVNDLKAGINFMNGYIPTGGFNIPEMEDMLIDVMSAMEQLRKLKKEECTLTEFVNNVYDDLKKCAAPKFGHTDNEGIAVSDARRHFESLLSFTNKYSKAIKRITSELNDRSNETMSQMFAPENTISNKTLDQTTINKINEIPGFVKSIQRKLASFDKYSTDLLGIADFILDKQKLIHLFGNEFIDD